MDELLSINQHIADGIKTDWDISFAGGYISREHVKVFVFDNEELEEGVVADFDFVSDYVISIVPAVAAGKVIRIYRDTPYDEPLVNFSDGSVINEGTLDLNAKQAVFLSAELRDRFGSATDLANVATAAAQAALAAQGFRDQAEGYKDDTADIKAAAAIELTGIRDAAVVDLNAIKTATEGVRDQAEDFRDQTEVLRDEAAIATGYRVNYARDTKANLDLLTGTFVGISAAVYTDANPALNGIYSWNGTIWVKISDLPEVTAAAAVALLTATYTYKHSVGNRQSVAVIADFGTAPFVNTTNSTHWQALIDGAVSAPATTVFIPAGAVTNKIIAYVPKVAERAWFIANAIRVRSANTVVNGTWRPVGFKGITYNAAGVPTSYAEMVFLGTEVTLSGTNQEIAFTNNDPYEAYGLAGTATTPAVGSGVGTGIWEIEVKARGTDGYGRRVLPNGGTAGQVVRVNAGTQAEFVDPSEPEGRSLLSHLWLCDEGHGRYVRDQIGGSHFDLQGGAGWVNLGAGGSAAWENGELVLRNAAIATSADVTGKAFFVIYEVEPDVNQYIMGHGTTTGNGRTISVSNRFSTTQVPKMKMLHGNGIRDPFFNGNLTMEGFNVAGVGGCLWTRDTSLTGRVTLGATRQTDWAGMVANPLRILAIAAMSADPTASEAEKVRDLLDWHLANRPTKRILTGKYALKRCAVQLWCGESTNHTSLIMDVTPGLTQAIRQKFYNTFLMAGMGPAVTGRPGLLQRLTYWIDRMGIGYWLGNEGQNKTPGVAEDDRNRKMGPLYGFAEKELYAETPKEHEIFHFKLAQGGTVLAPFGTALAAGGPVGLNDTFSAGVQSGGTLFTSVLLRGWHKFEAELRRQGYGVDYVTVCHAPGLNDSTNLAAGVLSAGTFKGWLDTHYDKLKEALGVSTLYMMLLVPHLPVPGNPETYAGQCGQPGVTGYANDAAGQLQFDNLLLIRADCRQFVSERSPAVFGEEADIHGTNIVNGDSVHMGLAGMLSYGKAVRLKYVWTKIVQAFNLA